MAKRFLCLNDQNTEHCFDRKGHLVDVDHRLLQDGLGEEQDVVSLIFVSLRECLVVFGGWDCD